MTTLPLMDIVLVDRRSGSDVLLDMTHPPRYDGSQTILNRPSWVRGKSNTLMLKFPILEVAAMYAAILPGMEVWAGEKNESAEWIDVIFGGYVRKTRWSGTAGERYCQVELDSYDILFDKSVVHGWPMVVDWANYSFHSPPDDTDVKISGYPPGYSPLRWLVLEAIPATTFNGVVRWTLAGGVSGEPIDFGGVVDTDFGELYFDEFTRPSNVELPGFFMALTLRQAIELIMNAYALLQTDVEAPYFPQPVYWMGAVVSADPTKVIPQFRARDLAAL